MTNCTRPEDTHIEQTSVALVTDPWDRVITSSTSRFRLHLLKRREAHRPSSAVFGVRELLRSIKKEAFEYEAARQSPLAGLG